MKERGGRESESSRGTLKSEERTQREPQWVRMKA